MPKIKVFVISGGPGAEHDLSLASGQSALERLRRYDYQAEPLVIERSAGELPSDFGMGEPAFAFLAMRGFYGEDGLIQTILETKKVPYSGSGILASALASNKFLTLKVLKDHGFNVPYSILIPRHEWTMMPSVALMKIKNYLGYPAVVKPNNQGSSLAVNLVSNDFELSAALNEVFEFSREALVQQYLAGRETVCAVLDWGALQSAYPLRPLEIISKKSKKIFSHAAKKGQDVDWLVQPAGFSEAVARFVQKTALAVHQTLGCRGLSLTDMILANDGKLYILETNTVPLMTESGLLAKSAEFSDLGLGEILTKMIQAGLVASRKR